MVFVACRVIGMPQEQIDPEASVSIDEVDKSGGRGRGWEEAGKRNDGWARLAVANTECLQSPSS